ncbi:TatD family deoxyribonuclease [Parashewanella curva]|uniref:TatD family deoxyribonuclease n=1 Tax=Parashewanella curva TaxID=2338552 RepID=A0A3L8Q1E5_9GAMM|nr:TatD family hydrolase [Parashewanella curva]RLV61290.1 TatD family deoxyribonuclease [Parashewanella curva]
MIILIDSHAHIDFDAFDDDRSELFTKMKAQGIEGVLIPGISPLHWKKQLHVANEYECSYAIGVHPWFVGDDVEYDIALLKEECQHQLNNPAFVAIGEAGLDKIRKRNWAQQLNCFEKQIQLAVELEKPLIIHAVKAHNEVIELLQSYRPKFTGVIHGFYGSPQLALRYINLGFKLGIGGLLLNDESKKLHQTVKDIPLENFLIETDSPSMLPKNSDQVRNSPLLLPQIVSKLSKLSAKSVTLISEQLRLNYAQAFECKRFK